MEQFVDTSKVVPVRWQILAPIIALAGGVFGIPGAFYNETFHGSILVAFVGAPIIEEILKPTGVYLLLSKWPKALRGNQLYTAFLALLGGIAFALVESFIYLNVYVTEANPQLVLWRYTVCIGVHAICSFVFGFGINQKDRPRTRGGRGRNRQVGTGRTGKGIPGMACTGLRGRDGLP